jgi:hypothetical protein
MPAADSDTFGIRNPLDSYYSATPSAHFSENLTHPTVYGGCITFKRE